jgi:hypothetical protein
MPVIKRDINTRSIDEFFVPAQKLEAPKNPPKTRMPRQKLIEDEQKPTEEDVIAKYVKEYGAVSSYKVLTLDSNASIIDIISVFKDLRGSLESRRFNKAGILLVENDSVIKKYRSELRSLEVQLSQDWEEQGSDYRIILKAAKTYGINYQMIKDKSGWTYKEVKGKSTLKQ